MNLDTGKARAGHQRYLRGGRFSEPLATFAVTKCVEGRRKVLASEFRSRAIIAALDWRRQHNRIKVLAFCVMPDHYHALFTLVDGSLSDVMKSIGKYSATQINKHLAARGQFWQDGFHDHRCRDVDDILDRMTYIERNPVRAGFVSDACEWPYSSAFPQHAGILDRTWFSERC